MSFGRELRRERELRRISLREIAEATKHSVRYLEAMERNDFDALPGGLYNRGLIRAYCKHIGIDSEAMVNAYLLEERAGATPGGGGLGDRRLLRGTRPRTGPAGGASKDAARRRRRRRWLVVAVAAIVIAVGALIAAWLLDRQREPVVFDPGAGSSTRSPGAAPARSGGQA